jgi:hypothetical protein
MRHSGCPALITVPAITLLLLVSIAAAEDRQADSSDGLGARYEYVEYDYRINSNSLELTYRCRLKVTSKRGDGWAQVSIWENDDNRLQHAQVTLRSAGGEVILQKSKKELEKSCGFACGMVYSDVCG